MVADDSPNPTIHPRTRPGIRRRCKRRSVERTARTLKGNGFVVEVLDDAQAARSRTALLLRDGAAAEVWALDRDTLKESHNSHAIYGLHRI